MTKKRTRRELEQLRQPLEAAGSPASQADPAVRLARALLSEPASDLTCAEVQDQLPEFVAAELRHASVKRLFPGVTEHLLVCQDCGAIHADLLDLELGNAPAPLPSPDMIQFQRRLAERGLRTFVLTVAQRLVALLYPDEVPDLPTLAEVFFDQMVELPRRLFLQPASGRALGFSGGDLSGALRVLAATYVTTRQLEVDLLPDHRTALLAQGRLEQTVLTAAQQSALDLGIKGQKAQQFAAEYRRIALSPTISFPLPIPEGGTDV